MELQNVSLSTCYMFSVENKILDSEICKCLHSVIICILQCLDLFLEFGLYIKRPREGKVGRVNLHGFHSLSLEPTSALRFWLQLQSCWHDYMICAVCVQLLNLKCPKNNNSWVTAGFSTSLLTLYFPLWLHNRLKTPISTNRAFYVCQQIQISKLSALQDEQYLCKIPNKSYNDMTVIINSGRTMCSQIPLVGVWWLRGNTVNSGTIQ